MRKPSVFSIASASVVVVALFVVTVIPAAAQNTNRAPANSAADASKPIPRTADGKPDLSGIWDSGFLGITFEAGRPAGAGVAAPPRPKVPPEHPSYQPWAAAKAQEYIDRKGIDDPMTQCLPVGVPRITIQPMPFQIIQTPGKVIILYEYFSLFRVIPTDGTVHAKNLDPTFMGDSVAHWEGDTLVVDVTGFNDKTWLQGAGTFHSEELHVVERYTRTSYDNIEYEAKMDDPKVYTKPWTMRTNLILRPEGKLLEFACMEGNEDMIYTQTLLREKEKEKNNKK